MGSVLGCIREFAAGVAAKRLVQTPIQWLAMRLRGFSSGETCAVLVAIALILIPRQLFAWPLFSWANTLGLSDSLFRVILQVVTGLGVIYFTRFSASYRMNTYRRHGCAARPSYVCFSRCALVGRHF